MHRHARLSAHSDNSTPSGRGTAPTPRWSDAAVTHRLRIPVALALFALLAAPSWPGTVDDVYITLAYARHWAETGALAWTTGERVEGYSNFLFMALMALGVLGRIDIDLLAQLVPLLSAAVVVAMVERRLPHTLAGTLALVALVTWAPFNHWSVVGLETTFYGMLLATGWVCVLGVPGRWGIGIALLAAASITRPEGALQLAAAAATVFLRPVDQRGARWVAFAALVSLAAYHAARIQWFDALLPTSYLVKVSPIGLTRYGALQLTGDLLTAAGLFIALLVAGRTTRRDALWVTVPLAIQAATLVRASGDWMSWGRLTMPGVLATVAAFASVAVWRSGASRAALGLTALVVVTAMCFEPRGYGAIDLNRRSVSNIARSVGHLRHGLDTPIAEDVSWVIDNVPLDAAALVVDAGMLGDVPRFRLIDMRGLTHLPAAKAIAANRAEEWLRATVSDAATRPAFLRLANWDGVVHPPYPDWLVGGFSLRADLRYGGGSIRWYAATDQRPTPAERRERWDEMLRRHPSHPFLAWHAALSAAETGDFARAERLAEAAERRWPSMAEFRDAPRSLSFVSATRALDWSGGRGFALQCQDVAVSRMLAPEEAARLVVSFADDKEHPGIRAVVDDPCGPPTEADPLGGGWLVACPTARSVTVTVACGPEVDQTVYVQLASE